MNIAHELPAGTHLAGKYRVEKVIGQGGFGITYLAQHISSGLRVCVKELYIAGSCTRTNSYTVQSQNLKTLGFDEFKIRFMNEAKELAKFNHPGIVKVTDIFEENKTAYFVMDYIEGKTLKQLINEKGKLTLAEANKLIYPLMEAVEAVHSKSMLHRDIKPDNVLVTKDGHVVLIDFGSARSFGGGHTMTQTAILTPGYAPLEQYSEKARRGPYTDIYSLAATIYFILTGTKPIAATERSFEELPEIQNVNQAVSFAVSEVIFKAMELKPELRYQTMEEFRVALLNAEAAENKGSAAGKSSKKPATSAPKANNDKFQSQLQQILEERKKKNRRVAFTVGGIFLFLLLVGISVAVYNANRSTSTYTDYSSGGSSSDKSSDEAAKNGFEGYTHQDSINAGLLYEDKKEDPYDDEVRDSDKKSSDEESTYYTVEIQNQCSEDIEVSYAYFDGEDNSWRCTGWRSISGYSQRTFSFYSTKNEFYWMAKSNSYRWVSSDGSGKTFCIKKDENFSYLEADETYNCDNTESFHTVYLSPGYNSRALNCNNSKK